MLQLFAFLCHELDVNVVGYDYSGYGGSTDAEGGPLEAWTYSDITAVYQWCVESGLVKDAAKEIVLYGQVRDGSDFDVLVMAIMMMVT